MRDSGFSVSFNIKHPSLDLRPAAERLGIVPFRIWLSGEQRTTPRGKVLEGVYGYSYCCLRLNNNEKVFCSELISRFLLDIEKDPFYWSEISSSGGEVYFVVFGIGSGISFSDDFSFCLLKRISDLSISLKFDF